MLLKIRRRKKSCQSCNFNRTIRNKSYRYIRLNITTHAKPLSVCSGYSATLYSMYGLSPLLTLLIIFTFFLFFNGFTIKSRRIVKKYNTSFFFVLIKIIMNKIKKKKALEEIENMYNFIVKATNRVFY